MPPATRAGFLAHLEPIMLNRTAGKKLLAVLKKILPTAVIFVCLLLLSTSTASTLDKIPDTPQFWVGSDVAVKTMTTRLEYEEVPDDALIIQSFLNKINSPMKNNFMDYYNAAKENDIDPYLLPAISGVESSFGVQLIPGSYNPFGWNGGRYYFPSFKDAIYTVARSLRTRYAPEGEITPERIGRMYAQSWATWIPHVNSVSNTIKNTQID